MSLPHNFPYIVVYVYRPVILWEINWVASGDMEKLYWARQRKKFITDETTSKTKNNQEENEHKLKADIKQEGKTFTLKQ